MSKTPVVCIVDDDHDLVRLLSSYLKKHFNVVVFRNGLDLLHNLANKDLAVDCLLIDVQMPEIDGYELLRRLRDFQSMAEIPAVGITAHEHLIDHYKFGRHGFDEVVLKPFQLNEMVELITKFTQTAAATEG